jgi:hypothetical protein
MEVDLERTTGQDIIHIGSMGVLIREDGKIPIVTNNKVATSTPEVAANYHETSGSSSNFKYLLPRWCPLGLIGTQRRKLQRLRFREEEGEGAREAKGRSFQPVQASGTSRERMESQDQLYTHTGQTGGRVG